MEVTVKTTDNKLSSGEVLSDITEVSAIINQRHLGLIRDSLTAGMRFLPMLRSQGPAAEKAAQALEWFMSVAK
jgi:hypothetical protein